MKYFEKKKYSHYKHELYLENIQKLWPTHHCDFYKMRENKISFQVEVKIATIQI